MEVIPMTHARFQEAIGEDTPVLVNFQAPWCRYCRRIDRAYGEIAEEFGGKLRVAAVDIEAEPTLAEQELIEALPTLVLYRRGRALDSLVAPESKAMILRFLGEALKNEEELK